MADNHAVVHAGGAPVDRVLGIPGEALPGSYTAGEVVRWYTGHPDAGEVRAPAGTSEAVVIGNGNVALDIARLLRAGADVAGCAPAARTALARSTVRRVDVVARGGPDRAAFTTSELVSLLDVPDLRIASDARPEQLTRLDPTRRRLLEGLPPPAREPDPTRTEIVLRFDLTPVAIHGTNAVERVTFRAADGTDHDLGCGLLVRAVGFRRRALPGLPFDDDRGVAPNDRGRVTPGVYVAGWAKRGPSGQLGHNRTCAAQTVARLLEDHTAGLLHGRRP